MAALAAMAMLSGTGGTGAQSTAATGTATPLSHLDVAELERMFWVCDWSTTRTALSRDMFTVCSVAWDELKARKFDGDYDRMIAWWRENKAAAHAGLQARRRTAEAGR